MKILFCSSEVVPFAKTGGLADVSGSLPLALKGLGVDVRIVMPLYKVIKSQVSGLRSQVSGVWTTKLANAVDVYFIENDKFFGRDGLYGDSKGDYPDNLERFIFFSKKCLEMLKEIDFIPDLIHCNDWQTALIPIYIKTLYRNDSNLKNIKVVFTIHNLSYQGLFAKQEFEKIGLGWDYFSIDGLEFYGKVNLLKGALLFSEKITTVSPTYSKEMQTPKFGCGLEGVLTKRKNDLFGILNGIDYNLWNPETDTFIAKNFSEGSLEQKLINKEDLQAEAGMSVDRNIPLLGLISRLIDQKGFDILGEIIREVLKLKTQFILLGIGENKYHLLFEKIHREFPNQTSINLRYDVTLAQKIYAGSDIFLMPSQFEPCGLGQMISLRYGTIPIVRKTGGLADTVIDYNSNRENGTGFVFEEYKSTELFKAIKRALEVYRDKTTWKTLMIRGMRSDFSWENSASKYLKLYKSLIC